MYVYEFYRGTKGYGAGVAKENTIRFWVQRFRSGNFVLQNQPCGRRETKVENEELKAIVEVDPSQTTSEIAPGFGVIFGGLAPVSFTSHYSFLKSGQTITTADIYCQQLQTMKEELATKQPRLVNRSFAAALRQRMTTIDGQLL
ncbi:hypothetical protein ABMA28_006765 [Loxostege sticticalis]|uniref:Mos1 transposase HTH domain-containing protein n=1 Tax=Loxostege sticticalis TaxID=481309 RepID=A0ABD0TNH3_LOXSC